MIIDIILLILLISGFWWGFTRGTFRALIMIVAYLVALLLTLKISPWMTGFLSSAFKIGKITVLIFGTLFLFILLIFLIHFIANRINKSIQQGNLNRANKIFGGIIMTFIVFLLFSFLLWPINKFGMISEQAKASSKSYSILMSVPEKSKSFLENFKPLFNRYWQLMEETIEENKTKNPE